MRNTPNPFGKSLLAAVSASMLAMLCLPASAQPIQQISADTQPSSCDTLARDFHYPHLRITSTVSIAAGTLQRPGIAKAMPAHCVIQGKLNERISPVDGKPYAIGFEMRLPEPWNERFFYQANGGLDGVVTPAYGDILGGGPLSNGLLKGFAVLSSDAGHEMQADIPGIGGALFGRDPQARLDYGYNAVAQLTPMAKALIQHYYGRPPARSYFVGASNGGRHGMVAAARNTGGYDGILAGAPGFNLPRAAVAQLWDAQQFARLSGIDQRSGRPDLQTSFSTGDLQRLSDAVLAQCDELDGIKDGIVSDLMACQQRFDLKQAIPDCDSSNGAACLSRAQKDVLAAVFAGPRDSSGTALYSGLPWDAGVAGSGWRTWKFNYSVGPRDAVALAFVFSTPPASPEQVSGKDNTVIDYALSFNLDRDAPKIFARTATYPQSAIDFMTLPDPMLQSFVKRGGKLMIYQGASDPVFSELDTIAWYEHFIATLGPDAFNSVRLFNVPGMNHVRGGMATDQFDMVDALVAWVETSQAPDFIVASARGPGSALVNPEIPASWSPTRSRLLCPFPKVARFKGTGNPEMASSFSCEK